MTLNVSNHNRRLQADHFIDPQIYFERNLTSLGHASQPTAGVRLVTRMLAGAHNRCSDLTCCNVTNTFYIHEITIYTTGLR